MEAPRTILDSRTSLLGKAGYAHSTLPEVEQRAYEHLVSTIAARGRIRLADYPELQANDVSRLLACIDMDHPELFWMDGYQSFWAVNRAKFELLSDDEHVEEIMEAFNEGADYDGDGRISFMERRLAAGRAALQENPLMAWAIDDELGLSPLWFAWRIDRIQEQLDAYVEECARGIPEGADDYTVLKHVFEFVARHTTYDMAAAKKSQDARSVMVSRRSVCKGYAEAFQYLLLSFGVPCFTAQGYAGANEKAMAAHAWNYVLVDGVWNRVDVTAADWDLAENPERAAFVPERIRSLFVDYTCMCLPPDRYHPAPIVAYPETGVTSDYFAREGYDVGEAAVLNYAHICLRLFTHAEPYVLMRYVGDHAQGLHAIHDVFFKKMCVAANLDEAVLELDYLGCLQRAKLMTYEEFMASPMARFELEVTSYPGKTDVCLVTATGCQGEAEGD